MGLGWKYVTQYRIENQSSNRKHISQQSRGWIGSQVGLFPMSFEAQVNAAAAHKKSLELNL